VLAYILARSLTVPLKEAIGVLRAIRGGNYRVELPVTTGGEVGELQASIGEMSVALDQSKQDLENKVAERTRDLLASRNEALRADADKRKLIQKVNSIIEDERKSIAVEIHDELNASLIAVRLESQTHPARWRPRRAGPEIDQIRAKAQAITKLALDLYANGRRLVRRLRPEVLDMLGLHGAVEEMVRHYRQLRRALRLPLRGRFFAARQRAGDFRLPHRAGSAVEHHEARDATSAEVSLVLTPRRRLLHIEVEDDGEGFDPAVARRASASSACASACSPRRHDPVRSAPGDGHDVAIALPLHPWRILRYRSGLAIQSTPSTHHVERIEDALREGQPEPDHHLGRLHRLVRRPRAPLPERAALRRGRHLGRRRADPRGRGQRRRRVRPLRDQGAGRPVFFNNNGIHPGEPEGVDACMALVRDFCQQPERLAALGRTVFLFVPLYNVDGSLQPRQYLAREPGRPRAVRLPRQQPPPRPEPRLRQVRHADGADVFNKLFAPGTRT
jgi:hypothetical protein